MEDPIFCRRGKYYSTCVQDLLACTVLHNFCLLIGDEWDDDDSDDGNDGQNPNYNLIDDGDTIREILKDHL